MPKTRRQRRQRAELLRHFGDVGASAPALEALRRAWREWEGAA